MLGKNAHAWPEVWFDGLGWVQFEPTPGRGAPGTEAYTGLPAAQDEVAPPAGAGAGDTGPPVTRPPLIEEQLLPEDLGLLVDPGQAPAPVATFTLPEQGVRWGLVGIAIALVAALLLLPEVVRRWRRRRPSADVARQINDLWRRAIGAVEATGYRIDPSLTPIEQARAAAPRLPVAARPLNSLAAVTTAAAYAPPEDLAELVRPLRAGEPGPRRWCRQVERIAADSMTAGGRIRRYFTVWW